MTERPGYAVIPRTLLHDRAVPSYVKLVYVALSSYAGGKATCWPKHATLAEDIGVSVATVKRALVQLRELGYLSWRMGATAVAGRRSNIYTLLSPDGSVEDADAPTPVGEPIAQGELSRSLTLSYPVEGTSIEGTSITTAVDEVTLEVVRDTPERPRRSWEPNESARARALSNAQMLDVDIHIDRYLIRCRELEKKPSNAEWLRWFMDDEQKARTEYRRKAEDAAPTTDDTGTPKNWSKSYGR